MSALEKIKKGLHYTILPVYLIGLVGLFLSCISIYVSPSSFWLLAFFGLLFPYLFLLNLLFCLFWIFRKRKWLIVSSVISLLIVLPWYSDVMAFHASPKKMPQKTFAIKVMSYNVRVFDLYNWKNNIRSRDQIFEFLATENPDIICFQEYFDKPGGKFQTTDTLVQFLKANHTQVGFIKEHKAGQHFGVATFSRFPIINSGEFRFGEKYNICIYSDVIINKDTFRIYNIHLESIRLGNHDYMIIDSLKSNIDKKHLGEVKGIARKLKAAYIRRANQVNILAAHIRACPYKIILCGDFNDTPVSFAYHRMIGNLEDAFLEAGSGFGSTYNGTIPLLRIDYIFYDKRLNAYNFRIPKMDLSDHYPVICDIEIK